MKEPTHSKETIDAAKRALRRTMLERRLLLPPEARQRVACAVAERLSALRQVASAPLLFVTFPYKNEVDLRPFISSALERGQRVAMPRCSPTGLELVELVSLEGEWRSDSHGIPAPYGTAEIAEASLDCLLFPGLAFDRKGNRLGYGAGMLDQLAKRANQAKTIGICHSWQITPDVPATGRDVPVTAIVTELATHNTE